MDGNVCGNTRTGLQRFEALPLRQSISPLPPRRKSEFCQFTIDCKALSSLPSFILRTTVNLTCDDSHLIARSVDRTILSFAAWSGREVLEGAKNEQVDRAVPLLTNTRVRAVVALAPLCAVLSAQSLSSI